ncbi:LAFE_0A06348g1_1 [Lachancea fermentati]|uniref:LAFE_0A06348g1_1 n=1 Tax=Lachancea fermentati TaxID=4955 RepID=A0A1G4M6Z6_LACFM|nr:LAFE_0A06348g1_1 [Lachancea fermentati]
MSVSGTPVKMFSTPIRPVTQEKLASVREKVVRESPYLYKNKVLSDPMEGVQSTIKLINTPTATAFHRNEKSTPSSFSSVVVEPHTRKEASENSPKVDSIARKAYSLGDFENPVLAQYNRRVVNKELETKRIIFNVIIILFWNLVVKYLRLFVEHTRKGTHWRHLLHTFILERVVYPLNPHINLEESSWVRFVNIESVSHMLHLIVFYNVTVSLWRLLVKAQNVNLDDLKLTQKQKELLGISETPSDSRVLPEVVLTNKSNPSSSSPPPSKISSNQPFLFKSLRTPLKSQEHKMQERQAMSAFVNKVNAFGDLRKTTLLSKTRLNPNTTSVTAIPTPTNRSGYIPSSRYAYMMDSPSPRKRM